MYATNYFEDAMLKLLKNVSIPAVDTPFLALFMSDPGDEGDRGYEVEYSGYARQAISFSVPAEYGTGMAIQNTEQISFAECPVNVGTVTHVAVMDSSSGGNMLLYGMLDTALNLQAGVTPIFRIGSIRWIWTGNLGSYYRTAIMNVFRGEACSGFQPYIGLCNGNPEGSGAEFAGYNYSRIQLAVSAPEQQENGTAMCYNVNPLISSEATGNWGTMSYVCVYDAATNGNIFAVIPLGTSYFVASQTSVGFHVGSFRFSVN